MKVIIPVVDDKDFKNVIADRLFNAEYACIYYLDNHTAKWLPTDEVAGFGGNLSIELKRLGIYRVICNELPPMVLGLFKESGIEVFYSRGSNVDENMDLLNNGLLEPVTKEKIFLNGQCAGTCRSCGSTCN